MRPLTPRQARFVEEYVLDLNATQAALRAGYSKRAAKQQGGRLLTYVDVKAAIEERLAARSARAEINAAYVLGRIQETVERCLQKVPVLDKDGEPTGEWKFEPAAVLRGAELLGKHLGLFVDTKVEVTLNWAQLAQEAWRRPVQLPELPAPEARSN